jgi:hypothetical protein
MSIRRNVFVAVMLASLAARASAREGGLELTSTTGFRANPLALFQDFRLGYRWNLERPGGLLSCASRSGEPVENLNGPMIKLEPVASCTFAFRGSGWFDAPTVFANVGWWIKHRYRAGEDVSRAIPTAVIGFSFKSW